MFLFKPKKPVLNEARSETQDNVDLEIINKMNQEFAVSLDLNETLKTALQIIIARLEAQAARGKYLNNKVLISEFTYMKCPDISFTKVDTIKVKGKEEPITIYSIDK